MELEKSSEFDRVSLEKSKIKEIDVSESSKINRVSHEKLKVRFFYLKVDFSPSTFTVKPNGILLLLVSGAGFPLQMDGPGTGCLWFSPSGAKIVPREMSRKCQGNVKEM